MLHTIFALGLAAPTAGSDCPADRYTCDAVALCTHSDCPSSWQGPCCDLNADCRCHTDGSIPMPARRQPDPSLIILATTTDKGHAEAKTPRRLTSGQLGSCAVTPTDLEGSLQLQLYSRFFDAECLADPYVGWCYHLAYECPLDWLPAGSVRHQPSTRCTAQAR